MGKRKASKYRRSVPSLQSIASKPVFDTAEYTRYLDSLVPPIRILPADVPSYEAALRLRSFVSLFAFSHGGIELSIWPQAEELEWIAERFKKYLEGAQSLDEAFGLKKPSKGRGSAKEKIRLHSREIQARAIYVESLSRGSLVKQALATVEKEMSCSAGEANSLVFLDRSSSRSNAVRKTEFGK